jgi:hypothetical protein
VLDRKPSLRHALKLTHVTTAVMFNDLRNAMDSEEMVSRYGPANWAPELMTLGALNNRLAALSTIPPYGKLIGAGE